MLNSSKLSDRRVGYPRHLCGTIFNTRLARHKLKIEARHVPVQVGCGTGNITDDASLVAANPITNQAVNLRSAPANNVRVKLDFGCMAYDLHIHQGLGQY